MTNDKLPKGTYTAIFEIFTSSDSRAFRLSDETLITQVYGDNHYKVITFTHDRIDNQYTKAIIQFSSDGQAGEITFQLRYYGSKYDKDTGFIVYSRVIKGKQSTSFNHNIFSVSEVDDNHEILYFENIDLNGNGINSLADPSDDRDAANKRYVDSEIAKIPKDNLLLDGSKAMKGNLNMGDNPIIGIRSSSSDNSALTVGSAKAVYFPLSGNRSMQGHLNMGDNPIIGIKSSIQDNSALTVGAAKAAYLSLGGSSVMKGNLFMANHSITGLIDPKPSNSNYAASVNFVNKTITHNNATITTN